MAAEDESDTGSLSKTCNNALEMSQNELHAMVTRELHPAEHRKRILWEVYTGSSRLSEVAETLNMEVQRFGPETGWDFNRRDHQHAFMELLDQTLPDEVFLSPTCGPWSRMQNIAAVTEEQKAELLELREWHHRVHLRFARRVFLRQIKSGRHAHIEQPLTALSWQTAAFKSLPGLRAHFDQCAFGSACMDVDGQWKLTRKPTTILTSKRSLAQTMTMRCDGSHEHCRLEGHMSGFGVSRTSYMENYQPSLAAVLAACISSAEEPHFLDGAFAVNEDKTHSGQLVQLMSTAKAEATRTVQRLHRNLGHPTPLALAELLASRGASDVVVEVAKQYQCSACQMYHRPNQPAPASLSVKAKRFNEVLQADVLWVKLGSTKHPILSVIDEATRFQAAIAVKGERSEHLINALERGWVRHFGLPTQLHTDEGRGWLSEIMSQWTSDHDITHTVAPGEAHTRLALVERRHAVLRKASRFSWTTRSWSRIKGWRQPWST